MEEEGHNKGKAGHAFNGALPDMTECGDGMDGLLAHQGKTKEELDLMVGNAMESLETWKNSNTEHELLGRKEDLKLCSKI